MFFPFLSRQKAEGVESSRTLARVEIGFAFNVLAAMAFIIFGERFVIALLGKILPSYMGLFWCVRNRSKFVIKNYCGGILSEWATRS